MIFTGLLLLCFVGTCIYFVGGVSATVAPIRKYVYEGNINHFGELLKSYCKFHPEMKYQITARDSSNLNVNYRDIAIDVKEGADSLLFGLDCEESGKEGAWNTEMDLVEAINITKLTGGYRAKADGIKPLIDYFERKFVSELNEKQHANIRLKKEGFFERIHIY